jgi:hypothetical protein
MNKRPDLERSFTVAVAGFEPLTVTFPPTIAVDVARQLGADFVTRLRASERELQARCAEWAKHADLQREWNRRVLIAWHSLQASVLQACGEHCTAQRALH